MPGAALDVTFTDDSGATGKAGFSLDGLTAALVWIDERQGRLGSERVAEAPTVGLDPAIAATAQPPAFDLRTAELVNLHYDNNCSVRIDAEWPPRSEARPVSHASGGKSKTKPAASAAPAAVAPVATAGKKVVVKKEDAAPAEAPPSPAAAS